MKRALALVALAIAGFTFGVAGCGEDDDGSPGGTMTTFTETGMTGDKTTNSTTGDDDGDNSGPGGGGGADGNGGSGSGRGDSGRPVAL